MCEPSKVRQVLSRFSLRHLEEARHVALEHSENARKAGDKSSADLFKRVADECSQEAEDRLLEAAIREVAREAQRLTG
jgi:hypothetical protein